MTQTFPSTELAGSSSSLSRQEGSRQEGPSQASSARPHLGDLVERFYEVAARRADCIAVEGADLSLTYAELDRISNQLAHRLRALGVVHGSRVGVSLNRGPTELVALLATAKAGGAYVPLDPSHPPDRLRIVLDDATPQVLLTYAASPLLAAPSFVGQVLLLDDLPRETAGFDEKRPNLSYDNNQIAYILFTSGSTGRPKGVEISRGAFANFLGSMAHTPGMSESERLLAITTTSFDIAGLELFLPLWVGASVVIVNRETTRDPRKLARRLDVGDISLMQATPATWRLLLEAGWQGSPHLRMFCGGEALSSDLANRILVSGAELWNLYGPTETTVWSSVEHIRPGYDRITIGRPVDRTQIYVFDEALNPVETGKEGELWIGGEGLARGYYGRPDLTAQRFVQHPGRPPGDRIYRTGDLGRQLEDGRFECLGRLDHQIKLRGFRIELGEIESVLRSVPGVGEVLVIADQRDDVDQRLLAYWVGEAGRDELIEEARRKLPPYMVPSAYVRLDVFPLNTNGKIDRKRLPKPDSVHEDGLALKQPRTDTETRIASIWSHVLGVTQVSVDQDFFTLGGTSALAAQVMARLERETGLELPLQAFFEAPTVEGLATRLGKSFSPDDPITVWLRRGTSESPPLWCLFGVTLYQDLALALPGNQSVIGVHIPFRYVPGRDLRPTITEIASRYVELIRAQQRQGPYHLLGLCLGGIVAYEAARQLEAAGERVAGVVILDALLPTAIKVDQIARVRSRLERAVRDPREFARFLAREGRGLLRRVPQLEALATSRTTSEAIDLPVSGAEAEAAVLEFTSRPSRVQCPLLVVRAAREPVPSYWQVDPNMGWDRFADRVILHEIGAQHLQVLREPHVQSLAAAIAAGK